MTIRLGILGATRGLNFALAAMEHKLDLEVAAVCDYFPPLLEKVKANLPENSFSPAYYTDFSDMIQNTPLDAVVIANNANEHARYAIQALEHGLHVLSEVLPVQTPAEAVALCEAVEKSGKKYFYAENYCYMRPNFEAALRYRRGEIGTGVRFFIARSAQRTRSACSCSFVSSGTTNQRSCSSGKVNAAFHSDRDSSNSSLVSK